MLMEWLHSLQQFSTLGMSRTVYRFQSNYIQLPLYPVHEYYSCDNSIVNLSGDVTIHERQIYVHCVQNILIFLNEWQTVVCLHEQHFIYMYMKAVTNTGKTKRFNDCKSRPNYFHLWLSAGRDLLRATPSSTPCLRKSYSKTPWFSFLKTALLAKEQSLPISAS
jgi:hypothetical protein